MKRLIVISLLLTGCASSDLFVQANQTQTLIQTFAGPNKVSGGIISGQNYYRDIDATINNPWNGFYQLRNLWHL